MKTVLLWAVAGSVLAAQATGPSLQQLRNHAFSLGPEDKRSVTLKDGRWDDPDGGFFELHKIHAIGDVDGDKAPDIVAVLIENGGGSGHFYYLFTFLGRGGRFEQIEQPEWLGDRSVIERITIDRKGMIAVRFITHSEQDPSCCPTLKVENRYRVEKGKLVALEDRQ